MATDAHRREVQGRAQRSAKGEVQGRAQRSAKGGSEGQGKRPAKGVCKMGGWGGGRDGMEGDAKEDLQSEESAVRRVMPEEGWGRGRREGLGRFAQEGCLKWLLSKLALLN